MENKELSFESLEGLQVLTDVLSLYLTSVLETKFNFQFSIKNFEYLTLKKDIKRELQEPEIYKFLYSQFESKFGTEFSNSMSDPNFSMLIKENLNPFDREYSVFLKTYSQVLNRLESTNKFFNTISMTRFSNEGIRKLNQRKGDKKIDSLIQIYVGISIISYFITVIYYYRNSKLRNKDNFELEDFDIRLLEDSSSKYLQID